MCATGCSEGRLPTWLLFFCYFFFFSMSRSDSATLERTSCVALTNKAFSSYLPAVQCFRFRNWIVIILLSQRG